MVRLVTLNEQDDLEVYLVTFERIWQPPHYLTPQLTGKAQFALLLFPYQILGITIQ